MFLEILDFKRVGGFNNYSMSSKSFNPWLSNVIFLISCFRFVKVDKFFFNGISVIHNSSFKFLIDSTELIIYFLFFEF
jgi:hypothetical protein